MFSVGFLPPLLVTGLMMGLLLKQPDLGHRGDLRRRRAGPAVRRRHAHQLPHPGGAGRGAGRAGSSSCRRRSGCAHARLPGPVGVPARRRLPDHRVADQRRLGRRHRPRASATAGRSCSSSPRRTPTSSCRSSARSWGWSGVLFVVVGVRRAGLARPAHRACARATCSAPTWRSASRRCSACRRW